MDQSTEDFELNIPSDSESPLENGNGKGEEEEEEEPPPKESDSVKRSRSIEDLQNLLKKRVKLEGKIHSVKSEISENTAASSQDKWIQLFNTEVSEYILCMYETGKEIENLRASESRFVFQLDYQRVNKPSEWTRILEKEFPELSGKGKVVLQSGRKAQRKCILQLPEESEITNEKDSLLKRARDTQKGEL